MNLELFISNFFDDVNNLDSKSSIKEIGALKNSQPPEKPSFIINQKEMKKEIINKMRDCLQNEVFEHIVINAKVGGGKTHFLNWTKSRTEENDNFYIVKFQTQETAVFKYSFIKTIVAKLFQIYFEDFKEMLNTITLEIKEDQDETINEICRTYNTSFELAKLFFEFKLGKQNSAVLRIIGASHGKTELTKLKSKNLDDSDYMKIIQLFIKYKRKKGCLLILLDEFEHAYISLTPAARRNFFSSYKFFIDEASNFDPGALMLITAVTEQSAGSKLRDNVQKTESALWSRIEHKIVPLQEFNPADNEEFKELFNQLTDRYKKAYKDKITVDQTSNIRKKFFEQIGGNSSQAISYREAISTMLRIMEDSRNNAEDKQIVDNASIRNEYAEIIEQSVEIWNNSHYNAKPGMLKTSLEALLKQLNYEKIDLKDDKASVLYATKEDYEKLFYISISSSSKALANNLEKCIAYKDNLSINNDNFETIFLYQKQLESESIKQLLNIYPDIHPITLDENELYNLLAFDEFKKLKSKGKNLQELERVIDEIDKVKRGSNK